MEINYQLCLSMFSVAIVDLKYASLLAADLFVFFVRSSFGWLAAAPAVFPILLRLKRENHILSTRKWVFLWFIVFFLMFACSIWVNLPSSFISTIKGTGYFDCTCWTWPENMKSREDTTRAIKTIWLQSIAIKLGNTLK